MQFRKELLLTEKYLVVPWNGFDQLDRSAFPMVNGGSSRKSGVGDAACPSDAELFWLQRTGNGRRARKEHGPQAVAGMSLEGRRVLKIHYFAAVILVVINSLIGNRGLSFSQGTIVDTAVINALNSIKKGA